MALQIRSIYGDGAKGHHRFTLNITEDSTNINTNQSYISWSFVLSPIGNGYDWYYQNQVPVTWVYYINGTQYSGNIMNYDGVSTVVLDSGGTYIQHDPDGNKNLTYSFSVWSMNVSYLPGAASANGSMPLTYIPRQATLTSAPNFTDEENPNIVYSNPAGGAVTSLKACIADENGYYLYAEYRDIPKNDTSYTFELTAAEKNAIYEASKNRSTPLPVRFYVTTVIGGQTYYSTLDRTVTIVNGKPVIHSYSVIDTGSSSVPLTGGNNRCVIRNHNYMYCSLSVSAVKGATILSKTVTCGNRTENIADDHVGISDVESGEFIFTVTDSRGNVTTVTDTLDLIPYIPLTCDIDVNMSLSETDGTKADAEITVSGNFYAGNFDRNGLSVNTLTLEYRYKLGNGNYCDWEQVSGVEWKGPYEKTFNVPNLDHLATYTFQARATDKIQSVESIGYTARTIPTFDWSDKDFNFNVPVTVQGGKVIPGGKGRVCKLLTHQETSFATGEYIRFMDLNGGYRELYDDSGIAEVIPPEEGLTDSGMFEIKKDMTCLINVHVCSHNTGSLVRSWIKLVNCDDPDWKYAECIYYGSFTTSTISTVLSLKAGTKIGVITKEPMSMNSSGFDGSYIEIIEL